MSIFLLIGLLNWRNLHKLGYLAGLINIFMHILFSHSKEVAAISGTNNISVHNWLKRYGDSGIEGLKTKPGQGRVTTHKHRWASHFVNTILQF
ncbi:MAG: helix-turn-helix domain-containing protein [Sphingobacteriia bacterium]|nr:helix-turn-helix domain-containing protein [Sphingobacteriia bacterium]